MRIDYGNIAINWYFYLNISNSLFFTHEIYIWKRYWLCQYCHMPVLIPSGDSHNGIFFANCWAYIIGVSIWKHLKATHPSDVFGILFLLEFCIYCPFHLRIP